MQRRFLTEQEARTDPGASSAQSECCRQSPAIADTAGCDHRHRRNRVNDRWRQRHRRKIATNVPAGLKALRCNYIDTGVRRASSLLNAADLHENV